MQKSRLLIGAFLCTALMGNGFAQQQKPGTELYIYKWESNGLIHYSHIKPNGITNVIRLDSQGRTIEEFTEEFDEIIEIAVRPKKIKEGEELLADGVAGSQEVAEQVEENREDKAREQNCEIAKTNIQKLNSGEVYEPDSKGNMILLTPEQIKAKRANVQRDFDYFCEK